MSSLHRVLPLLFALCEFTTSGLRAAELAPLQVVQVLVNCPAGTLTVLFTQPVQLDGAYTLDHGASVQGRRYGASTAEVVLATSPLASDTYYELDIANVHSLAMPALTLAANPTRWGLHCADGCYKLTTHRGPNQTITLAWFDPTAVLQASSDLSSWADVACVSSPFVVTPSLLPKQFYRLRCVDGTNSGSAPIIGRQPLSVAANPGDNVEFTAAASGVGSLSYQWLFNGVRLPGATTATLPLASVSEAEIGVYQLCVTNAFGAAISRPAYLSLSNNTGGLALNLVQASPAVSVLLLNSQNPPDLPLNVTLAQPSVGVLLLNSQNPPDAPLNTTLAQPAVAALLLNSQNPPDFPLNTTVAQPPVAALLLNSQNPPDFPLNTTVAQPPVQVQFAPP